MSTDFTYGGNQIVSNGPFKPSGKDMPVDARTRVESFADIVSIPNPHVGLKITVKVDETNDNKMTDYIVKSLKANSIGVANSLIDEVVRYVDYLGVSGVSGEGLTTEQSQQLQTAYEHSQSTHVTSDDLLNIDAISLNGKKFNGPMSKEEYDSIENKDPNTIYLVDEDTSIIGVPDYSINDNNKVLAVNSDGTALAWVDAPSGSGSGLTTEQANQLTTAYTHSQSTHVSISDIPTKVSELENDSNYVPTSEMNTAISNIQIESGNVTFRDISNDEIFVGSDYAVASYGNIIVSTNTLSVNEDSTISFNIKLDAQPSENQTVSLAVNNENISLNKANIIFTSSDYSTEQTITVTPVHDIASYEDKSSTITLSSPNVSNKTISVTIKNVDTEAPVAVTGVTLNYNDTTITVNGTVKLIANVEPSTASNKNVRWSVDNENCTVVNGTVTGVTEGSSVVTVTTEDGGFTATCNITISGIIEPASDATFLLKNIKDNTTVTYDSNAGTNIVTIKNLGSAGVDWTHRCITAANKIEGADVMSVMVDNDGLIFGDGRSFGVGEVNDITNIYTGSRKIEIIFKPINETFVSGESGTGTTIFGLITDGWSGRPPSFCVKSDDINKLQFAYTGSTDTPILTPQINKWNILTYSWDGTADAVGVVPNPGSHLIFNGEEITLTSVYGNLKPDTNATKMIIGNKNFNIKEFGVYTTVEDTESIIARHNAIISQLNS